MPLTALYVSPQAYGSYEIVLSLCALLMALMGFGVGDTANRFLSTIEDESARRRAAAATFGTIIVVSAGLGLVLQAIIHVIARWLAVDFDMTALRLSLLSISFSSLIEFGLVWLRIHDRGQVYFTIVTARTVAHVAATWLALILGRDVAGVLMFNAFVLLALELGLGLYLWRELGATVSRPAMSQLLTYGAPIVLGSLALVAVGSLNRLFLNGVNSVAEIGLFGLASRLALAAGLAAQPFILWWFPKRLAALDAATGHADNVRMWGYGVALTMVNALAVLLVGPLFIHAVLPQTYWAASELLPGCVTIILLGQIVQMSSEGALCRTDGLSALAIDLLGAALAICCLYLLAARWGVAGAIAAGISAHLLRLILHVFVRADGTRLTYPIGSTFVVGLVCCLIYQVAPTGLIWRAVWSVPALALVMFLFHLLRIAELSPRALRVFLETGSGGPGR